MSVGLLVTPAAAHAWTAGIDGQGALVIDGGPAANATLVAPGGAGVEVSDAGDVFAGGAAGCVLSAEEVLSCPLPAGGVVVHAGEGADDVTVSLVQGATVTGDGGDDLLTGGRARTRCGVAKAST